MSKIQWTEETWNPIVGCSVVSPGCTNCYAMKDAWRKQHIPSLPHYHGLTQSVNGNPVWTGIIKRSPEHILLKPLKRRAPTIWFVNSMSDLFHENIPDEWIDLVFAIMALCERHTFQVLTKRADRMKSYMNHWFMRLAESDQIFPHPAGPTKINAMFDWYVMPSTLPNVWLGVSCERQQEADERIPPLLHTLAAVRFISAEPLIGPIDVTRWNQLDWVIVGGESGRPRARPFHLEWAADLISQCAGAGVPCFVKQVGSKPFLDNRRLHLADCNGGDMMQWPIQFRVRQMPQAAAPRSPVMKQPSNAKAIVP